MKITAIHDGKGFVGCIETPEQYIGLKAGTHDWKPHVKASMEKVVIPKELFDRLLALDKEQDERRAAENDNSTRTE